jgi:glutaredoxin-dependent peroxiredoxin
MALMNGTKAPDFTLVDTDMKPRSLKEFAGKSVVLAFYPGAFTGVCTKELCAFRDAMTNFNAMNAQVVGISVDGPFANKAFANANGLTFPLLSDYTADVSKKFGGVHEDFAGMKGYTASKRAVFIVDKIGMVKYSWVSDNPGVEPLYDEIKKVLSAL